MGAGGGEERAGSGSASMTTMHARFRDEVECKMTSVQADYFLRGFPSSSPTSQAYRTAPAEMLFGLRAGNACVSPCRTCISATPQLKREKSLLPRSGEIADRSAHFSNGFWS